MPYCAVRRDADPLSLYSWGCHPVACAAYGIGGIEARYIRAIPTSGVPVGLPPLGPLLP